MLDKVILIPYNDEGIVVQRLSPLHNLFDTING